MKRFIWLSLLGLTVASFVYSQDITVEHRDSLVAADTADIRTDTLYTLLRPIPRDGRWLNFATMVITTDDDTNFVNDSLLVKAQVSLDGSTWTTLNDTIQLYNLNSVDRDTLANSTIIIDADASVLGNFIRFMFVYWDSIGIGAMDSLNTDQSANVFPRTYGAWYTVR